MAYRYAHPATSFNGIWQWLQGRSFFKKLNQANENESWNNASKIMVEFMESQDMKVVYHYRGKNKQNHYRDENSSINARKIQPHFKEFKQFVIERYETEIQ